MFFYKNYIPNSLNATVLQKQYITSPRHIAKQSNLRIIRTEIVISGFGDNRVPLLWRNPSVKLKLKYYGGSGHPL